MKNFAHYNENDLEFTINREYILKSLQIWINYQLLGRLAKPKGFFLEMINRVDIELNGEQLCELVKRKRKSMQDIPLGSDNTLSDEDPDDIYVAPVTY